MNTQEIMEETATTLEQNVANMEEDTNQPATSQEDFTLETDSVITDEYFEKTCKDIEEMNFVEVKKLCAELKKQQKDLVVAKESIEQIMQLQELANTNSDLSGAIMEADAEVSTGIEDFKKFLDSYDDTKDKLARLVEKTEERIKEFDGVKKTTSYLTNSMLEIIDKNFDRITQIDSEKTKHLKKYYSTTRHIFANRTSVDFLLERISARNIEVRRLKASLKNDKRGDVLKATKNRAAGIFGNCFNTTQLEMVEGYLSNLFGYVFNYDDITFYFLYVLSLIYEREKTHGKYGNHKWVEVLFMNIIDIRTDMYDLDGGVEYYNEQLLKLKDALIAIL